LTRAGPFIVATSPRSRAQIVRRVCEHLEARYGVPRLGNPRDPTDDLVYVILSNRTGPHTAASVFSQLKRSYPTWRELLEAPIVRVRRVLQPAGLSRVKTRQIRAAFRRIEKDWGAIDLSALSTLNAAEAQEFLVSLPGVSEKVAKCVMMYTLGFHVLPVDVHVHRIASRLAWIDRKRADQCHRELEAMVPSYRRFAFHVGCVMHGRSVCRPKEPACGRCFIHRYCRYAAEVTQ
jgi:endonuclease III